MAARAGTSASGRAEHAGFGGPPSPGTPYVNFPARAYELALNKSTWQGRLCDPSGGIR